MQPSNSVWIMLKEVPQRDVIDQKRQEERHLTFLDKDSLEGILV